MLPRTSEERAFIKKNGRYSCSNCDCRDNSIRVIAAHVMQHDDPHAVVMDESTEILELMQEITLDHDTDNVGGASK